MASTNAADLLGTTHHRFPPVKKITSHTGGVDYLEDIKQSPLATTDTNASTASAFELPDEIRYMSADEMDVLEKKLVRKIDGRLLPMLIMMYILNYLDRNNIAAARLASKEKGGGLQKDLNLTSQQYNTCVSILFVGYILMQIPSNLFLNKIGKPSIYLPICMTIWGIISGLTALTQSYSGLLAIRFFLGFVEAAYFPGCLFFLSSWYTRKELSMRMAVFYSGSLISGAFSGLIAAGVVHGMDGAKGIAAWRWLFILEGSITVFVALCAVFVLPDFPRTTKWLTPVERAIAVHRLQRDIGVDDWVSSNQQSLFHGFVLAFKDLKTYILALILMGIVSSASVTNFFPTVVKTLKYGNIETLLLTAPPYVLAVITTFLNAWHADRTGERYLHVILPLCVSVLAFILAAATTGTAPRYVAMMLMPASFYAAFVVGLSWISSSMPRPPAKRAAALAAINAAANATSIYASYMYNTKYSPRYVIAMGVNCGTAVMAIAAATALRVVLVRLNRKLDAGEHVEGAPRGATEGDEGTGIAAKKGFRFLV